ncbi:dTDP-4-dehydrorhamnose reductase [Flavobacterium aciduliphilum]|uniref:dTDP-4-dehydrorhamnose reductase n=1 Tax=Flavobacterium aciduliphilum TaxID=1101402 RepID=A0A328YFV0_9FLAO|nr:dTDP-4-dehydrorhamnose reductase [Flavobacterium aciduliphilum]RAR72898.1 dTDP-4-dehydrorhamnose reductase [Flavobacterium aciduliphilum]
MVVLVTGANGQLGQAIQSISRKYTEIDFVFCSLSDLDITNIDQCRQLFEQYTPNYCINAAAYTAVDKAESEPEKAHLINVVGTKNLAEICKESHTILLHVSTDFVFDGENAMLSPESQEKGYSEEDLTKPTGVYGQTKLDGEKAIQATFNSFFIIRTSWVFSQFANNFMKTMLRLATERDSISVVNDQIGTPTHAVDLAEALLTIITHTAKNQNKTNSLYGIYNFSNEGRCSWYDFAKKIFEVNHVSIAVHPIPTTSYPTPAKRPHFSVLNKDKIKTTFDLTIRPWQETIEIQK